MNYAALKTNFIEQTGARLDAIPSSPKETGDVETWYGLWGEIFRTQVIKELPSSSTTVWNCFSVESLPVCPSMISSTTVTMLEKVESLLGSSVSNMAKALRVSRPMIYHYREGMEPSTENRRRLLTLAELARDWSPSVSQQLKIVLDEKQPEGRTLLEFLSDENLDIEALRQLFRRNAATASDQALRRNLAATLDQKESDEARGDIMRERHAAGKSVYVGDPGTPGKLIQIRPDGSRVRGQMIKRRFVPDEE